MNNMYLYYACAESKDFAQHAHMRRLLNAFASRLSSCEGMFLFTSYVLK